MGEDESHGSRELRIIESIISNSKLYSTKPKVKIDLYSVLCKKSVKYKKNPTNHCTWPPSTNQRDRDQRHCIYNCMVFAVEGLRQPKTWYENHDRKRDSKQADQFQRSSMNLNRDRGGKEAIH